MDELRNYLNELFEGVPETPDVLRAKAELLQMMEDKYDELTKNGSSEAEATRTVINEFGSFDEVTKELGVDDIVSANAAAVNSRNADYGAAGAGAAQGGMAGAGTAQGPEFGPETEKYRENGEYDKRYKQKYRNFYTWSVPEVESYFKYTKKHAFMVAAAVALCILAPFCTAAVDDIFSAVSLGQVGDALSGLTFFTCIALAVAFFILSSRLTGRFGNVNKDAIALDAAGEDCLRSKVARLESTRTAELIIGIILCILAPASSGLLSMLPGVFGEVFGSSVLLVTALGVFFIIYSVSTGNRIKEVARGMKRYDKNRDQLGGESSEPVSGDYQEFQPKYGMPVGAIVGIVIVIGLAVYLSLGMIRGVGAFMGFGFFSNVAEYDGTSHYALSSLDGIEVDTNSESLVFETCDGNEVLCEFHGKFKGRPEISVNAGARKLVVKSHSGGFNFFNFGNTDGVITIRVPRQSKLNYDLDVTSGDANLQDISAGAIQIESTSGNFNMNNVETDALNTDFTSGDLNMSNCSVTDKCVCESTSGNISMNQIELKDINIDSTSGDTNINLKDRNSVENYNITIDTTSGDINCLGTSTEDLYMSPAKNTPASGSITVNTTSGDVSIN